MIRRSPAHGVLLALLAAILLLRAARAGADADVCRGCPDDSQLLKQIKTQIAWNRRPARELYLSYEAFGLRRGTTAMNAFLTGITLLFLAARGRPVSARAFLLHDGGNASMCDGVRPCRQHVFDQIQCQVAQLNMSAQRLFDTYLERQGPPFTENPETFCAADRGFPPFANATSEKKEMLVSLYKIFVFFNASLGNITRDQESLGDERDKAELLKYLRNAAKVTRGLLANLTCLLCSEYKVRHVDVAYGDSSGADIFEKKKRGCQVLRKYAKVIARAARSLGRCRKET